MKIGFLFGAGAEISYGMPTGGKFALDIFRESPENAKEKFRTMRSAIDSGSRYATNWLPDKYIDKRVSAFGNNVFEAIIKDTIGNNRRYILDRINDFDKITETILLSSDSKEVFEKQLKSVLKVDDLRDRNLSQKVRYNSYFQNGNSLFSTKYFSAILSYYKENDFEGLQQEKSELGSLLKAILQLQIGAMSEELSRNLQENIFETDELDIDIFDDLTGQISVDYHSAGVKGLEILSNPRSQSDDIVIQTTYDILETIYANVLDYKTLIDSYWHYLYSPKNEWSKFCKISIFLYVVQQYINNYQPNLENEGYYDDLKQLDDYQLTVATTNYTSELISVKTKIPEQDIYFLNGNTKTYYNPYLNQVILEAELNNNNHFVVPLMFTQSGTKPMTSIEMSEKYVSYFNELKEAECICSIGFGFNNDDEHINNIFRNLIEKHGKKLIVVNIDNGQDVEKLKEEYSDKLKISKPDMIDFILVDKKTRRVENVLWTDVLEQKL